MNPKAIAEYVGTSLEMIERSYGRYIGSDGLDPLLRSLEAAPRKSDEVKLPVLSAETRKMLLDMTRRSIRRRIANRFGAKAGTRPGTFALGRLQEAARRQIEMRKESGPTGNRTPVCDVRGRRPNR
jgi:hypothetical protein